MQIKRHRYAYASLQFYQDLSQRTQIIHLGDSVIWVQDVQANHVPAVLAELLISWGFKDTVMCLSIGTPKNN